MASKNDLDIAFEEFEKECSDGKTVRREMIENLRKVVANPEMAPSQFDKPMMVQAKISVFKTLDDLLNSESEISLKKLKMKLARKDSESNGLVGATIVNLLKSIRPDGNLSENITGKGIDDATEMAKINERSDELKDASMEITDGELEECGVRPTSDQPDVPPPEQKDEEE